MPPRLPRSRKIPRISLTEAAISSHFSRPLGSDSGDTQTALWTRTLQFSGACEWFPWLFRLPYILAFPKAIFLRLNRLLIPSQSPLRWHLRLTPPGFTRSGLPRRFSTKILARVIEWMVCRDVKQGAVAM
ncbi:hypothetical protein BJX66DRAFT_311068 [Aspergillus keveii]|uniref:Uncharacterized protein n=1 Tax=Aspergillus keveii TaxID=714993 RepID=A0ABR4FVS5_9EURO